MGCRCNERQTAIVNGVRSIAKGDTKAAASQARFVLATAAQDAAAVFRQSVATAKARLTRR